jgi:hypothetical protein
VVFAELECGAGRALPLSTPRDARISVAGLTPSWNVKVSGRPLQTRGLAISGSGFTDECVEVCRQARLSQVILMTGEDIVAAFEHALTIGELIRKKAEYAMTEGRILVGTREIVEKLTS